MDISTDKSLVEGYVEELPPIVKDAFAKIKALQVEYGNISEVIVNLERKKALEHGRAQKLQAQQLDLMAGHLLGQVDSEEAFKAAIVALQRELEISRLWVDRAEELQKHFERLQFIISGKISLTRGSLQKLRSYKELIKKPGNSFSTLMWPNQSELPC